MGNSRKLYSFSSKNFQFPWALSGDSVVVRPGNDIPQLHWPDGSPCWLANLYILKGYREGKSRRNKGGTLLTWAKHLSHLIRWCYSKNIDFFDLEDGDFVDFIRSLEEEVIDTQPDLKARSSRQVSSIASTVLNFLAYINKLMVGLDLIGLNGKIKAEQKQIEVKKGGRVIKALVWTHECLPRNLPIRRRQPISTDAVEKLYNANDTSSAPGYIVRRRFIMLRLFELTGARRIEISHIKVQDLIEAGETGELKIFSAKQRNDQAKRCVPITKVDLREILSFVKHYRSLTIKKTIGTNKDHGYLFVNAKNGKALETDTLTSEFYILRKAAKIEDEEACLHAFRHRFITRILRELIRIHRFETESELKKALLSVEAIKHQLTEWTGHSSIAALDYYVHLAFEAETGFSESIDILQAGKIVESLHFIVRDYQSQAKISGWSPQLFSEFETMVSVAEREMSLLLKSSSLVQS